jgi:hypothetical protein
MVHVIDPGDAEDAANGGVTDEELAEEQRALESMRKVPAATTRHRAAAKLRVRGADYNDIAETLGYTNGQAARAAVEIALADMNPSEDLTSQRQLALARLEGLLRSTSKGALSPMITVETVTPQGTIVEHRVVNEGHIAYAKLHLSIIDRIIKLQGIDAPTQIELRTPDAIEFEKVIAGLNKISREGQAEEGDIFTENAEGVFEGEAKDDE